jgi:PAS domain S-box-containing protein
MHLGLDGQDDGHAGLSQAAPHDGTSLGEDAGGVGGAYAAGLEADLAAMHRLYDLQSKLAFESDLEVALGEIVGAAADFCGTDRGCVQLVSEDGERLEMFVHRGYGPESEFIRHFLRAGSKPACDAARQNQQRTIIEEVATFPALLNTEDRRVALADGVCATQSTPMISRKGDLVGVLSTQFRHPHRPSERVLKLIDMLAWTAADFVDRHMTEAALRRANEGRYRAAMEVDTVPVVFFDMVGGVSDANDAYLNMIGYTRAELDAGEVRYEALTPPDWAWRDEQTKAELLAVGRSKPFEKEYFRRDGSRIWIYCAGRMLDRTTAVEFIIDLTDRKRAEAALLESEQRFRQFADTSTDALWIVDTSTEQLEYLSPAYERIWGEPRGAAMADIGHWTSLVHPDDRIKASEGFEVLKSGQRLNFEYRIVRPHGEIRYIHNAGFPILQDGKVQRIAGVAQDLTERRLAEHALAESERRARSLVEGVPQLVWRAEDQGDWTWASPQWSVFTDQPERASHGSGWLDAIHPDDRDEVRSAWDRALKTGEFDREYRIRRADGTYMWFATRATPVRDERGAIREWLGTSTEIHALRELQARQGVLVAELQHRTRNLIAIVRSLSSKTVQEADTLEDFEQRFATRLAALSRVQGLLSQLTAGQRVTFDELLRSELTALGAMADGNTKITLDGPADVSLRSTTVQTFALALHELATNATKYGALSSAGGHLTVGWRIEPAGSADDARLHVDWRETGVDMARAGGLTQGGGYGRELIERALPYQLKAKTSYELGADGVHCTIAVPVPPSDGGVER